MSRPPSDDRDTPPAPRRSTSLLRRCALGIWLCGIALIGAMEFHRAGFATGVFMPSLIAWLWLAGSVATGLIGLAMLLRELRAWREQPGL